MKSWVVSLSVAALVGTAGFAAADETAAARAHYQQGTKLYNLGRYAEAVKEYEAAYELKDDPALLFNIGQAYRANGDSASALRAYRAYLRTAQHATNRALVEERIAELQKVVDQQAKTREGPPQGTIEAPKAADGAPNGHAAAVSPARPGAAVAPVAGSDQSSRGRTLRIAGLSLIGVGAGALVGGGVFVALAKSTSDEIARPGTFSPAAQSRLKTYEALEVVGFALGGVAVATGVALFVVGRAPAHRTVAIVPLTAPTELGAMIQGQF